MDTCTRGCRYATSLLGPRCVQYGCSAVHNSSAEQPIPPTPAAIAGRRYHPVSYACKTWARYANPNAMAPHNKHGRLEGTGRSVPPCLAQHHPVLWNVMPISTASWCPAGPCTAAPGGVRLLHLVCLRPSCQCWHDCNTYEPHRPRTWVMDHHSPAMSMHAWCHKGEECEASAQGYRLAVPQTSRSRRQESMTSNRGSASPFAPRPATASPSRTCCGISHPG
jgi:hypothetical protein